MQKEEDYYVSYFERIKPCEKSIIGQQLKINENLKDKFGFKFNIYTPIPEITIGQNEKWRSNYYEKQYINGIFIFKYHLIVVEESPDFE